MLRTMYDPRQMTTYIFEFHLWNHEAAFRVSVKGRDFRHALILATDAIEHQLGHTLEEEPVIEIHHEVLIGVPT